MSDTYAYCSWCFEKTTFTIVQHNNLGRDLYKCDNCGRYVSQCMAFGCDNYACNGEFPLKDNQGKYVLKNGKKLMLKAYHEFCGEHRGVVPNFETIKDRIFKPSDYKKIYKLSKTNYTAKLKIALTVLATAIVTAGTFWFAGPAIGAFVGSLMGLSGAAAVSAGLAFLGGGSLAAGGFGMFGGMVVITVCGAATGGVVGGLIGSAYFGQIDGFDILKKEDSAWVVLHNVVTQLTKD